MMDSGKYIWLLCVLTFFMSACNPYDVDEILMVRDDISLTWKGAEQMTYDPLTWQMGYNARKNEFRVHDDSMGNYFIVTCNAIPDTEGQELEADMQWTMKTSIKRLEGVELEVKKTSADGRIWLWGRAQGIGVVVRKL